jgi:DNA ligase-associated metallophosphoesterase
MLTRAGPDAATDPTADRGVGVRLAGEPVRLLAQRAIWWPAERTLFVADVHLGKAEAFQTLGVAVPSGPTGATLERLGALVDGWSARRLVVLGDLLHAPAAQARATVDALRAWRHPRATLECVLVRGNHDDRAGDPPADLGIAVVDAPTPLGPYLLCHAPDSDADSTLAAGYRLAGHQHPAVRLSGRAGDRVRVPCFRIGPNQAVLPAFGAFTGSATVSRCGSDRLFAIAGDRVLPVPPGAAQPARPGYRWGAAAGRLAGD